MGIAPDLSAAEWRTSSYSGPNGGECIQVVPLEGAQWRKSSHSGPNGGDCVEVAALAGASWQKSTHSGPSGGECVEVAALSGTVAVRDSKDPDGPVLAFSSEAFASFVADAAAGRFPGVPG